MGRVPTRNKNLPSGMRARHRGDKTYYFLDTGAKPRKEISLGQDYVAAVQKWAELTSSSDAPKKIITFRIVAERYQREVIPGKAPETQKDNLRELKIPRRKACRFESGPGHHHKIKHLANQS